MKKLNISNICRSISEMGSTYRKLLLILFKLRELKPIMNISHLQMIHYSIVQSHILYSITSWGYAYNRYLKSFETIQKTFIEIIWGRNAMNLTDYYRKQTIWFYRIVLYGIVHKLAYLLLHLKIRIFTDQPWSIIRGEFEKMFPIHNGKE